MLGRAPMHRFHRLSRGIIDYPELSRGWHLIFMNTPRSAFLLRAGHLWGLLGLMLPALTGCVGVIPLPTFPEKVLNGSRIEAEDIAFIRPGETTRDEIEAVLGTNHVELLSRPAVAYSWEVAGGGGVWWVAWCTPYGSVSKSGTWLGGWRACLVAYDDKGCVKAARIRALSPRYSLHHHLRSWVNALPAEDSMVQPSLQAPSSLHFSHVAEVHEDERGGK